MNGRYLRLTSLRLEGFGPFREPKELLFPPGLSVFARPNEAGKSTIAAAVSAAFFGLPSASDPDAFGTARYRNWDDPRRFEVAVAFEVDGVPHRLRRNLDTHRVALFRKDGTGWRQVAGGEHNPNAKKPNAAYSRWLLETFGHASRELYEATFSLRQPFAAAARLDGELQSLLAGGGSGHLGALELLVEAAKGLTSATAALGLTPRDGRRPGRLDEVRAQIRALSAEMASGRESVEELQRLAREISDLATGLEQARGRLDALKRSLEAFSAWRLRAQKVRDRREEVAALRRTLRELHRLEEELAAARAALEREYPELDPSAPPLDEMLDLLAEAVRGGLEVGRVAGRLARVREALEESRRTRRRLIPWETGPQGASAWVEEALRAVEAARKEWSSYRRLLRRKQELQRLRTEEFRAFEEAAPAALGRAEEYRLARSVLEERLRATREMLEREEARLAEARARLERVVERYADICDVEHLAGEIDRARELEVEAAAAQEAAEANRARLSRASWIRRAALACALAFLLAALSGRGAPSTWLLAGLAAAVAAVGLLLFRLPPLRRAAARWERDQERAEALRRELQEVRGRLGPLAHLDREGLEQVRFRIASYREALAMLDEDGGAPEPQELERLREEVARCEADLAAIDREVAPFKEAFGDFEAALARWRELCRESAEVERELRHLAADWGVPDGLSPAGVEKPAGVWAALAPYAEPLNEALGLWTDRGAVRQAVDAREGLGAGAGIQALAELIDSLDESFWEELRRRARAHDDQLASELDLLADERRLGGGDAGALQEAVQKVRLAISSLERAWPGEWAALRERLEAGLEGDADVGAALRLAPSPLRELIARAGGLEEARRRYEEFCAAKNRIAHVEAKREGALRAAGCEDESGLERRLAEAEAGLNVAVQELEALVREHPGLPERGEEEDVERVAQRAGELEREVARLQGEVERGEERLRELARRQASLQGARPINLAQAELELGRLRREEERLQFELRAVAVAYAELKAAAEEYYASHLERLAESASAYFAAFTGRAGRRIAFDEGGRLRALEPDGREVPLPALSQGARDQLYLAFRIAVSDLLSWNRALPFILDDPFVNCDDRRLGAIRRALEELAKDRQVVLFSHREDLSGWGAQVEERELSEIAWEEEGH